MKKLRVASWNVEHFRGKQKRMDRVLKFLKDQKPDVFGLYEVVGGDVFETLVKLCPEYQFHITEGPQVQEILVGVRKNLTAFFTQNITFKSGVPTLRPGALLTVTTSKSEHYTFLFLHTKSSSYPLGLGIRDDQFRRAFRLKRTLDRRARKEKRLESKYVVLGDLNTVGMRYPYKQSVEAKFELQKLDRDAAKVNMRRLQKDFAETWYGGKDSIFPPSDIDHVLASNNIEIKNFKKGVEVQVRGWPTETNRDRWVENYSDHALLYFEILY